MLADFYLGGYLAPTLCLVAVLAAFIHLLSAIDRLGPEQATGGVVLVILVTLLIGLRPINSMFVDMVTYADVFQHARFSLIDVRLGDPLFNLYTHACARLMDAPTWFLLCAALYVVPKAWASRIWFGPRWPIALAAMVASFSFYAFGVNGIRNGLAASLALLAIAWPQNRGKILIGIAASLTHLSVLLTLVCHLVASRIRSVGLWLAIWFAAIPVSVIAPAGLSRTLVSSTLDERSQYLEKLGQRGFRLDFILYSFIGVAAVIVWKYLLKYKDEEYDRVAGTYLLTNAVWVMINQVNFSNRFAFLSWFMIEVVVLFPLLRQRLTRMAFLPVMGLTIFNAGLFYVVFA